MPPAAVASRSLTSVETKSVSHSTGIVVFTCFAAPLEPPNSVMAFCMTLVPYMSDLSLMACTSVLETQLKARSTRG
eukprot:503185-Amphidinium_carterae.1